jgi:hypothetical protein
MITRTLDPDESPGMNNVNVIMNGNHDDDHFWHHPNKGTTSESTWQSLPAVIVKVSSLQ